MGKRGKRNAAGLARCSTSEGCASLGRQLRRRLATKGPHTAAAGGTGARRVAAAAACTAAGWATATPAKK